MNKMVYRQYVYKTREGDDYSLKYEDWVKILRCPECDNTDLRLRTEKEIKSNSVIIREKYYDCLNCNNQFSTKNTYYTHKYVKQMLED